MPNFNLIHQPKKIILLLSILGLIVLPISTLAQGCVDRRELLRVSIGLGGQIYSV